MLYKVKLLFIFICLYSFSAFAVEYHQIQVTNQQWYVLNVQCGTNGKIMKLKPYQHITCHEANVMHIWRNKNRPKKNKHISLSHLCGKTSTSINLHKKYFEVVQGFCSQATVEFGARFVISGGPTGSAIRGVGW